MSSHPGNDADALAAAAHLAVRPMVEGEIPLIVDYFLDADDEFLVGMGVDLEKLPTRDDWIALVIEDFAKPLRERSFYYLIWELDGQPVGHCNINKIVFGGEAYMHLHIWTPEARRRGVGVELVAVSARHFCDTFQLVDLFCEPYALNQAPNRTLAKSGFVLVDSCETTPGWLNFHQPVNRWRYDCGGPPAS